MRPRRIILGFLWRFVLAYGLLISPWPGFKDVYARGFRALGNVIFAKDDAACVLRFEPVPHELKHLLDTRILLANRALVQEDGNTSASYLEVDARAVGWIPTALLLALVAATPLSGRRRICACFIGLLAVHGFIVFSLAIYIWNNSAGLGLIAPGALARHLSEGLEETLITQLGASFVVPVLIWLFATFRWQDLAVLRKEFFVTTLPGLQRASDLATAHPITPCSVGLSETTQSSESQQTAPK